MLLSRAGLRIEISFWQRLPVRFQRSDEKRLNAMDQDLIDGNILFDRPNLFSQSLILRQNDPSLWALNSVEYVSHRSIGQRHLIGMCEIVKQQIQFVFQSVKGLKDRDPGLIDGKEVTECHPLDGITLLNDILGEEITVS